MKVEKIKHYQALFLNHVTRKGLPENLHMYRSQQVWGREWDIESMTFHSMYDKSLTNDISGRIWGGSKNSAKESMLAMIEQNKEFMRSAFRDLFAVEKDLGLRCDRFMFYCDEAIRTVSDHKIIDHRHNRDMLCFYLAMEYPDLYTLVHYRPFVAMMEKLESRNIPSRLELERYQKSMRAIHTLVSKDESWTEVLKTAIGEDYKEGSLLVMVEFAQFVASQKDYPAY